MGGLGSGRTCQYSVTLDDLTSLDVNWLRRHGLQPAEGWLTLHDWLRNGAEHRVRLTATPCPFGGQRAWFQCPACRRRVGKLYALGSGLRCRLCCGFKYASQGESAGDRALRRERKIRARLGGSADLTQPFPARPARMHWRTFLRLRQRASEAQAQSSRQLNAWLDRLEASA